MIKIVGISGSPRKNENSEKLLKLALEEIGKNKISTEFISLAGKNFSGCIACGYCKENFSCSKKDDLTPIIEILKDEDIKGIILASPVYMGGMTSQAKAFLDRSVLFRRNGFFFKDKVAGAITIGGSRNGGQDITLQNILAAFMIHDMIIVPDAAPTAHFGGAAWERVENGVFEDQLALDTIKNLGIKVSSLVARLYGVL